MTSKRKTVNTPLGPRQLPLGAEKLFESLPTVPSSEPKGPEYIDNGRRIKWYEDSGRLYTSICPIK
ncbi:hypothetical protein KHQ81_13045 [Mycoplasmatota bacterium]|nr:hypothetical protein KHQ81_13045 [Mycoplasmatota bacterium]